MSDRPLPAFDPELEKANARRVWVLVIATLFAAMLIMMACVTLGKTLEPGPARTAVKHTSRTAFFLALACFFLQAWLMILSLNRELADRHWLGLLIIGQLLILIVSPIAIGLERINDPTTSFILQRTPSMYAALIPWERAVLTSRTYQVGVFLTATGLLGYLWANPKRRHQAIRTGLLALWITAALVLAQAAIIALAAPLIVK